MQVGLAQVWCAFDFSVKTKEEGRNGRKVWLSLLPERYYSFLENTKIGRKMEG